MCFEQGIMLKLFHNLYLLCLFNYDMLVLDNIFTEINLLDLNCNVWIGLMSYCLKYCVRTNGGRGILKVFFNFLFRNESIM